MADKKVVRKFQTDLISYGYSLAILMGGIAGYAKSGSVPSLAAGLLFSSFAAFGAYQTSQNPKKVTLGLLTSGILFTVMGTRFYQSGKFMPAGLVTALSLAQFLHLEVKFYSKQ